MLVLTSLCGWCGVRPAVAGNLSDAWALPPSLEELVLDGSNVDLQGTLPPDWARTLLNLKVLKLKGTFSGSLPSGKACEHSMGSGCNGYV